MISSASDNSAASAGALSYQFKQISDGRTGTYRYFLGFSFAKTSYK
jgi:hypothetical protein